MWHVTEVRNEVFGSFEMRAEGRLTLASILDK